MIGEREKILQRIRTALSNAEETIRSHPRWVPIDFRSAFQRLNFYLQNDFITRTDYAWALVRVVELARDYAQNNPGSGNVLHIVGGFPGAIQRDYVRPTVQDLAMLLVAIPNFDLAKKLAEEQLLRPTITPHPNESRAEYLARLQLALAEGGGLRYYGAAQGIPREETAPLTAEEESEIEQLHRELIGIPSSEGEYSPTPSPPEEPSPSPPPETAAAPAPQAATLSPLPVAEAPPFMGISAPSSIEQNVAFMWDNNGTDVRIAMLRAIQRNPEFISSDVKQLFHRLPRSVRNQMVLMAVPVLAAAAQAIASAPPKAQPPPPQPVASVVPPAIREESPPAEASAPPEKPTEPEVVLPPEPVSKCPDATQFAPQTLDEFPIYRDYAKELETAIELNDFAPIYVFAGPPGVGKTSMVKAFIRSYRHHLAEKYHVPQLEVENPMAAPGIAWYSLTNRPEESQVSFLRINVGSAYTTTPMLMDIPREVAKRVRVVVVLDDFEKLSAPAQQILIQVINAAIDKELARGILFVTVNDASKLNPALLSRATLFEFRPLTEADVLSALKFSVERFHLDLGSNANQILEAAARAGKPTKTMVLASERRGVPVSYDLRAAVRYLVRECRRIERETTKMEGTVR